MRKINTVYSETINIILQKEKENKKMMKLTIITKRKQSEDDTIKKRRIMIAIGAGAAMSLGLFLLAKKKQENKKANDALIKILDTISDDAKKDREQSNLEWMRDFIAGGDYKNLMIPDGFETAHIQELWMEGDDVLGIMNDIPIQDLGKFGEELRNRIPELADKDFAQMACVGFTRYNNDI